MRVNSSGVHWCGVITAVLMTGACISMAQEAGTRARLMPGAERKPAVDFTLKDSAGKQRTLKDYRGKILLLDFWATWCHGCKQEIPLFADLHRKYRESGLEIVGISMDDEGWKLVTPFVESAAVPYEIVLGDEKTAKSYHIDAMPDTFLIDRQGRIAAVYYGMVDREDIEKNVQALLRGN